MSTCAQQTPGAEQSAQPDEYEVLLLSHLEEPGYSVVCPTLGCASQGDTRQEALEMIAEAITLYLDSFARDGEAAPHNHDAMARALVEYPKDGCAIEKATLHPVDWDAIILRCDDLVLQNAANSRPLVERGKAYLNKGDDDRAIADYDTAISLDPNCAEAYGRRGDAHFNKREYDRAVADYDAALRRDPYDEAVLGSLEAAYIALRERRSGALCRRESRASPSPRSCAPFATTAGPLRRLEAYHCGKERQESAYSLPARPTHRARHHGEHHHAGRLDRGRVS